LRAKGETHLEISTGDRAVVLTIFSMAAAAWMLGFKLTESANHLVSKAAEALDVNIAAPGHTIAGWWIDDGRDSPVILLLHAVRADRSTMVTRAQLLRRHGFSVLLIDLQGHGETPGTGAKASAG
jgi:alpha-beta hydrolase superfamily lysophospholipase